MQAKTLARKWLPLALLEHLKPLLGRAVQWTLGKAAGHPSPTAVGARISNAIHGDMLDEFERVHLEE